MESGIKKTLMVRLALLLICSFFVIALYVNSKSTIVDAPANTNVPLKADNETNKQIQQAIISNFNNNFDYFDKVQKYASSTDTELFMWKSGDKLRATTDSNKKHEIEIPVKEELAFLINVLGYWMISKSDMTEYGGYDDEINFSINDYTDIDRLHRKIVYSTNANSNILEDGVTTIKLRENWYFREWSSMSR